MSTQLRRFAEALGIPAHLFGLTPLTAMSPVGAAPLPSLPRLLRWTEFREKAVTTRCDGVSCWLAW
jgi:hypothetical protein